MSDPFGAFDHLKEAIGEALKPLFVEVEAWQVMPDQRACALVLRVSSEAFKDDETRALEGIMEATQEAEAHRSQQEKIQAARDGLLNITRNGGIFAEDDTPEA